MSISDLPRPKRSMGLFCRMFVLALVTSWASPALLAQTLSGTPKVKPPGSRTGGAAPVRPAANRPATPTQPTAPPAQPPAGRRPARPQPPASKRSRGDDAEEEFKPREVQLRTKDGVTLRAFYFPSEKAKEAITVLLIHEWKGQGSPYYRTLAQSLQDAGCAVLVPDFRGHGGSTGYYDARGKEQKFDLSRMGKRDVQSIINFDLEKVKGFLREENNEGKLNLNALVVVGIRDGCVLASQWAQRDWSFPSVGQLKQGQDVKALVLVSPPKQLKGVPIDAPLGDPNLLRLPIMIVSGTRNSEAKSAQRLIKRIEGVKRRAGAGEARNFKTLSLSTALSGPSLVNGGGRVVTEIVKFVEESVPVSQDINPWIERP